MSDILEEFKDLQQRLEVLQEENTNLKARKLLLMERLEEEFKCTTVKQARAKLKVLMERLQDKEETCRVRMTQFYEKYGDLTNGNE